MATVPLVRYGDAPREVKESFYDIKRTRNVDDVNNFWEDAGESTRNAERNLGAGARGHAARRSGRNDERNDLCRGVHDEQLRLF